MPAYTPDEILFTLETACQAVLLVQMIQRELVDGTLTKDDRSPVTVADFAAQALVGFRLAQAYPADRLVAEEDSARLKNDPAMLERVTQYLRRQIPEATPDLVAAWIDHNRADGGERFWTLDPIDGTKGFLRGDQYAVALALVVAGEVVLGVLGCPHLNPNAEPVRNSGALFYAARGYGAWAVDLQQSHTAQRLNTSSRNDPSDARILRSFESGHTNTGQIDDFSNWMNTQAAPVLMDSQAKYAVLASGRAEILLRLLSASQPDYREKIWDQAAGSIVLEEAGGRISDLDGIPLDFTTGRSLIHNRGILASNGHLHTSALSALRQIGV
ncbi:MAG TPA: 3'(2'),5'-bisphosphate nucleotidase [Anaerolineales bacterium]|nr:3'(2'),5'-bisphosphate nucleotidase [Anaerolineales bacterium]